jgi:hypothetical protein
VVARSGIEKRPEFSALERGPSLDTIPPSGDAGMFFCRNLIWSYLFVDAFDKRHRRDVRD